MKKKHHKKVAKKATKRAKKIVKKADQASHKLRPAGHKHPGSAKGYAGHGHAKDKGEHKVEKVMKEYKHGELHSGSKKGPKVKNPKQAIAIGLSEARKAGAHIPKKK